MSGQRDHSAALQALVGQPSGPPNVGRDAVEANMIRHWAEAMGDENPVYRSEDVARAVGLPGLIAPPTMLQSWTMPGLSATLAREAARQVPGGTPVTEDSNAFDRLMALLDDEGLTSVVATNCEQEYVRPLVPGERVVSTSEIQAVSDRKQTALGEGRFVSQTLRFLAVPAALGASGVDREALVDQGELVATMQWRIFKFAPRVAAPGVEAAAPRPRRPRPARTEDNAFFFEGAARHELLVQRCAVCGTLRHPPLPACAVCRSFDWDTVVASGRGDVYSFVVVHHPQVPSFDYPLVIGLIELEEGTRLVAEIVGMEPADVRIGMPVGVDFVRHDEDLTLPVFRTVGADA